MEIIRDGLIALVDLDGTVADYDAAMERDLKKLLSPGEEYSRATLHEPYIKERINLIRRQPGWWENLERIPNGFRIVELLREYRFKLNVLTKGPYSSSEAWSEKVRWCREHLPDATIHLSEDKSMVYGKILFDDWPAYVQPWLKYRPRGLVIMLDHIWNRDFHHPQVVKFSGNNLSEVEDRIIEVIENSTL
jgi:5'(3')-deoxyribonucleotidase